MKTRLWLSVAVLILGGICTCKATDQCRPVEYSVGGMFLRGHTFKTAEVGSPEECYFKCEEEVTCQSYNFIINEKVCELNNRTKEARLEDFIPDWNRFYIKRLTNRGIF